MAATASTLRELHQLHQRAKALRDRLVSAPKSLAARQAALATKQATWTASSSPGTTPSGVVDPPARPCGRARPRSSMT